MHDIEALRDDLADLPAVPGITDPAELNAYWLGFIDTPEAALFYDGTERTMREWRQTGNGPPYHALTARMIRYRRIDLHFWAEARVRTSTSDTGQGAD